MKKLQVVKASNAGKAGEYWYVVGSSTKGTYIESYNSWAGAFQAANRRMEQHRRERHAIQKAQEMSDRAQVGRL